MVYPRITATISVIALIAVLALGSVMLVNRVGTALMHGNMVTSNSGSTYPVQHSDGVILKMYGNNTFTLEAANGEQETFQCSKRCLNSLGHMARHEQEHAHTDVYYLRISPDVLEAIDVD